LHTNSLIRERERGEQSKPLERKLHWILDLVLLLQRDQRRYWDKTGTVAIQILGNDFPD